MSWVFAVIGQNLSPQVEILSQIHTVPLVSFKTETLYLAAGGLKQTCLHHFGPIDGKPGGRLVLRSFLRLQFTPRSAIFLRVMNEFEACCARYA